MNVLRLALESFKNDQKMSDSRLVLVTQIVLIFFLATLSLTSASVQLFLNDNLNNMLGADLTISGSTALSENGEQTIASNASKFAKVQILPLAISNRNTTIPVQIKLVDQNYPLQGSLKIGDAKAEVNQKTVNTGPKLGEIWLGPRASGKLGVAIGDMVQIGEERLRFSATIFHEPDRIMEGHSVAMRALVNSGSIATDAFKSSNIRHRYLVEASSSQQRFFEEWVSEKLDGYTIMTKTGGGHPLSSFWQRTENFLGLASVILFFMAAIAIDMANRRYLVRQKHRLAIYLSFGQTLASCVRLSFLQWVIGFVLSFSAGIFLAYVAQYYLVSQLAQQFPGIGWGWHLQSLLKSAGITFLLLLAFQIPMFWQLTRTSLVSLIRAVEFPTAQLLRMFWIFASLTMLAAYYSDNFLLTGLTLGALGAALLLMMVLTWVILTMGEYWGRNRPGLLSFNFFIMKKRILTKSSQILGLGLCSLLLLFTLMLMKDIGDSLEGYTRLNDGNLMVAEMPAQDLPVLEQWAESNESQIRQMRPYSSAKLSHINEQPIDEAITTPSDSLATVKKNIRLSWSEAVPANNRLVDGAWWSASDENWQQISAEPEVMTDLDLQFGDKLTFLVNGKPFTFTLVASHAFRPGKGSVTFWFQIPEKAAQKLEADIFYMGSMELPSNAWSELGQLWKNNPALSLVPLKELTQRFDDTLAIVTKLTVGYAIMILAMAALVIAASMKGFESEDRKKNGLLMSIGITKSACLKLNLYDWLTVSLIAGIGAIAGTWIAGLLIYESQFSMSYAPDPLWLVGLILAISFIVCAVGTIFSRKSLSASIYTLMKE